LRVYFKTSYCIGEKEIDFAVKYNMTATHSMNN